MAITWKQLTKKHIDYNKDKIERMCLLYEGGYKILENAKRFLPKLSFESPVAYNNRLGSSSYVPFLSQFIDYFTSFLFSVELHVRDAADADDEGTMGGKIENEDVYKEFAANCDNNKNSLHSFVQCVFKDALVHGKAFVGLDFPNDEVVPVNRLVERQMGLDKPYLYHIDNASVIDWKYRSDFYEKLQWVKMLNEIIVQDSPLAEPEHKFQVITWNLKDDGKVIYEVFETEAMPINKMPQLNKEFTPKQTVETDFKEIPIFELCIEDGLAIGEKLGPMCQEYFQRRSLYVTSQNKALVAIPVAYLGPEIPEVGGPINDTQSNPDRGASVRSAYENKGITTLGSGDRLEIVETKGTAHEMMNKSLEELAHLMLQLVHQMANSSKIHTSGVGAARSAAALQEGRFATEIILTSYAKTVKDFVKEIYCCIAETNDEDIVWVVNGLMTSTPPDKDELIKEAMLLPKLDIPSETFKKKYISRVAFALLEGSASIEESEQIVEEIEAGVSSMDHQNSLDKQLMSAPDQASPQDNPSDPEVNGQNNPVGENGQPVGNEGMHLQSGEHVEPQVIFDQLAEDYKEKDIQWVLNVPWIGPMEVPLSSIDFHNKDNWAAADDQEHVDNFVDKITNEGFSKPIILVNQPQNDNKMIILDGHHRALAYLKIGQPAMAYVGQVGTVTDEMKKMHDRQAGSKQASAQRKMQSNQKIQSNQKK